MEIDEDLRVAVVEMDILREEHRCVAMGVEGEYPMMGVDGLSIEGCLGDKPLENG